MYTELTNWIILSIFALPASVYTIWHMKTDDNRVSKGFTLKDLIISVIFGLLPVMQLCMIICGCTCIIIEIMTKSDKISLFKAKKRYTQAEVDKLLRQIGEMLPLKEVVHHSPNYMDDSEASLPDSQKFASKLKYDDFV